MILSWHLSATCTSLLSPTPLAPQPSLAPQPIPLPLTATICLNTSLNSRYQNVNTACFALLFFVFCSRSKHGGARQLSRYGRIPRTAVTIMINISSLEHVLKCLTRQNTLTELTLDSSLESLDKMFFFFEQLPLLTTHVPECLVLLQSPEIAIPTFYVTSPKTRAQSICH